MNDMFFLVNVTQSQHDLQQRLKEKRFTKTLFCFFFFIALQLEIRGNSTHITCKQPLKCPV